MMEGYGMAAGGTTAIGDGGAGGENCLVEPRIVLALPSPFPPRRCFHLQIDPPSLRGPLVPSVLYIRLVSLGGLVVAAK